MSSTLPPEPRAAAGRRTDPYRRAMPWGMAASLLIHLVLALIVSRLYIGGRGFTGGPPRLVPLREGIEVVDVPFPTPLEPLTEPDRPEIRPGEQEVIRVVPGEPEGGVPEVEQARRLTNAERLRPRIGDPRLWIPYPDRPFPERLTGPYARADSAVRALLREWLDSLTLTDEERRRATEWTVGEGDKKWGISAEGLHLGDITIPIPFGALFGQSMSPNAQKARAMVRDFNEIRQQDIDTDIRKAREEALEGIRRRTKEELERRKRDTTDAAPSDSAGS